MAKEYGAAERLLVINPGATSTKFAVYDGEKIVFKKTVEHSVADTSGFIKVVDQYEYRLRLILKQVAAEGVDIATLKAVGGAWWDFETS